MSPRGSVLVCLAVLAAGAGAARLPWQRLRTQTTCPKCICGMGLNEVRGSYGRVVGGTLATPGSLPWLSGVARNGERPTCGATLVSDRHLITAAHCVDGVEASSIKVVVGAYDLADAVLRPISKIVQHPLFDAYSYDNDIAVLTLDEPVGEDLFMPACLPEDEAEGEGGEVLEGRAAMVAGWGQIEEKGAFSDIPMQAMVRVWPWSSCINAGYGKKRLTPRMLCAGFHDGESDACQGDSGGPLMLEGPNHEMTLIGVVSWGRGCARPDYPGVYTRVDRFLPFLRANTRGGCHCQRPVTY